MDLTSQGKEPCAYPGSVHVAYAPKVVVLIISSNNFLSSAQISQQLYSYCIRLQYIDRICIGVANGTGWAEAPLSCSLLNIEIL